MGAATASRLRADGRHVVVVDRDGAALAARWGDEPGASPVVGAVEDPATAEAAVAAADAAGSVDALVCCAGAPHDRAFTAQDDASWSGVLAGVVDGTRVMARAVARRMQRAAEAELAAGPTARPSARRIVALAPATTRTATAGGSASAAAGGAVLALTATLARELGPWGIRVNAVLVGFVETRLTARLPDGAALGDPSTPGLPEPVRQMAAATTALGRMGTPEEVAGAVAFLLGPDADYVTGAVLPVTGGLLGT